MNQETPEYSRKALRDSISPELFTPQTYRSFFYLLRDVTAIILLSVALFFALEHQQYLIAAVLSIVSGNFFFALFVVGHDCGHGSFSRSGTINNVVGFFAHHFLLTPYWAWKKSHSKHHRYSGNIDKDESIVPFSRDEAEEVLGIKPQDKRSFFKVRVFNVFIFLTGINFHLYTIYNGRTKASHFVPNREFMSADDDKWIYLGTLTNLLVLAVLISVAVVNLPFFLLAYLIPIMICYHLMGLVTLMQHHHDDSNWYYDEDWEPVKGALNTFDYRYGRFNTLIRNWHHDIANYHIVHHLFASIPHYYLKAATEELEAKKALVIKPKQFSYADYFKIIWCCNFVENRHEGQEQYPLKPFEEF